MLSIVAWFVYIVLLWGHYHEGWRGRRVVWFNVAGAVILTLAYFGGRDCPAVNQLNQKGVSPEHISTTTLIIILIIMVVISAYFSGSETGMMTLNRYRLRHMAKQGNRSAKRVENCCVKPDRLISWC